MNNIILNGEKIALDRFTKESSILVKGDSVIDAINLNMDLKLNITLETGTELILNLFDYATDASIDINVISHDNSRFILNACFICEDKYSLKIDNTIDGNDIESNVTVRGVTLQNGNVKILMNGKVNGKTHNNVMNEYAQIINKSDNTNVMIPNLIVDSDDVIANHGVSIGNFDEDEIFYLKTKGIDEKNAERIIEEGFILSIMDGDNREKIKNILMGR